MIGRSPITRDNALLGIITSSDLARMMYEQNRANPTLKAMSHVLRMSKDLVSNDQYLC
jgi:hypothetical protein